MAELTQIAFATIFGLGMAGPTLLGEVENQLKSKASKKEVVLQGMNFNKFVKDKIAFELRYDRNRKPIHWDPIQRWSNDIYWKGRFEQFRIQSVIDEKQRKERMNRVEELEMKLRRLRTEEGRVSWSRHIPTLELQLKLGTSCMRKFFFAGGGMKTGQVIGGTNRLGEVPHHRPVHFQSVFATLYHQLGINLETTITNRQGRPMYLLDHREPIREII